MTLAARFVLVKAMLESLPVFWMAVIPTSILNRIRQLMLNSLWTSSGATACVHHVKWEAIAKPKAYERWGVKNRVK